LQRLRRSGTVSIKKRRPTQRSAAVFKTVFVHHLTDTIPVAIDRFAMLINHPSSPSTLDKRQDQGDRRHYDFSHIHRILRHPEPGQVVCSMMFKEHVVKKRPNQRPSLLAQSGCVKGETHIALSRESVEFLYTRE
jgi:hypothetical protein